jgi:hypothetical protein
MAMAVTSGSVVLPTLLPQLRANAPERTPCLEKLNRQRWVAGTCFRSYGVRVGVRVNTPEALELLVPTFPPGWETTTDPTVDLLFSFILGGSIPGSKVRRYHLPYMFHMRLGRTFELAEALAALEMYLHLTIAEHARSRIFVHAGVVGWRGRALVIPGRTHTVPARRRPKAALRTLRATIAYAPVLKCARGEAAEVAPRILARMEELEPLSPPPDLS